MRVSRQTESIKKRKKKKTWKREHAGSKRKKKITPPKSVFNILRNMRRYYILKRNRMEYDGVGRPWTLFLTWRKKESEVIQSCPTLCYPVDCSPPGSSIPGSLQARIQEWVAISFSRGSSWPRDRPQVSCIAGSHFNLWATMEAHGHTNYNYLQRTINQWEKLED